MTTLVSTPQLSFNRKRVMLRRSTQQMNDPVVIKNKYKVKKSVKFNDRDEIRFFYKSHTPQQVHQDPPMMAYSIEDYQLTQPNWPARNVFFHQDSKIRMESVQLLDGDYATMANGQFLLEGRCRALHLFSQHASVHVRYTFDLWKSFQEVQAHCLDPINTTWDRYSFELPIHATLDTKTIYMAVRYTVDGQDHWDNNESKNFEIQIQPHAVTRKKDKVLTKRYDFTASLSAVRKPCSPPPSPPHTPPLFTSGIMTPPTPTDEQPILIPELVRKMESVSLLKLPSPTIRKIPSPTEPISAEGFQLSYTDFVNKYCFYNSHTTIYSTSPSAVIS